MTTIQILYPTDWTDYELIDSGDGVKLERFGSYTLSRPDPRAIWKKALSQEVWQKADAAHTRGDNKTGEWSINRQPPTPWNVSYKGLTFTLRPTEYKHIGVFPEQAVNWDWIQKAFTGTSARVLNLFAYTGGASIAAAQAGATVTHVDSVKGAIDWAHENARASQVAETNIRWIVEDAYKFVIREVRRGNKYDAIIMDPPKFGRGTKGEVWKVEEDLPKLLDACRQLLSDRPLFFLINAYTADLSSLVLHHLLSQTMRSLGGDISHGELALKESSSDRLLPSGIFARWQSKPNAQ